MINSKELLQKFSRLLGIPSSEGRMGLEIFVKLVSQKLAFGDEVEIESLGYFSYKKVKPVNSENGEYQKIILYSEEKASVQNKNFLLFFLPSESSREFPHIDSYLNLSFGKPLINSKETEETEFYLPSSRNEMNSLIESKVEKLFSELKIHQSTELNNQEFILPLKGEEEILFDTGLADDTVEKVGETILKEEHDEEIISEGDKTVETFDDYELVEPDNEKSLKESLDKNEENEKWVFDDITIHDDTELQSQKDSIQTIDGYSEVKEPLSSKTIISGSINYKNDLGKAVDINPELKLKKNKTRKLVPLIIGLILLTAAAISVYLNYDKIRSMVFEDGKNLSHTVASKNRIEPVVINRTFEIPVTYPYKVEEISLGQIADSLIISPAIFIKLQSSSADSLSKAELASNSADQISKELVRVRYNIYQRGSEYLVQVSSWKSKTKAESELKKYIENGFKAELVEESSADLGKYRKVIIGGFNSLEEAKNFLNQNK